MTNIGLFFGSFNPIHQAHVCIGEYFINQAVEEVWFVLTPLNPQKKLADLVSFPHRLAMLKLALQHLYHSQFKACDYEMRLSPPYYSYTTIKKIKEDYPKHHFSLILGEDNASSLSTWYCGEAIKKEVAILTYPRYSEQGITIYPVSSTEIRTKLKNKQEISNKLLDPVVLDYINQHQLYQNQEKFRN